MGEVNLTAEEVTRAKLEATYQAMATADNYKIKNNGNTILHFEKTGAGIATITVTTPNLVDGLAIADLTFTVPATTGDVFAGPFPPEVYNDSDGEINVVTSEETAITMAVLSI